MGDVRLIVNGTRYGGWKRVRVTRSIESISGAFELEVSDRWAGQSEPWPIFEEDACRVELDGQVVIDGVVDRRSPTLRANERNLRLAGKDRTAALVECSALLDRWSFRNVTLLELANKLAAPFGIGVKLQSGLTLPRARKVAVNPGETAFEVLHRAAQQVGALVVSDGAGGLLITRTGSARATPLIEGDNLLEGGADYSAESRYRRYVVLTQPAGTDSAPAAATRVRAEATDENVRRAERVLVIRGESGMSAADARRRADWEARTRAAVGDALPVVVQGWRQPDGALWPINALTVVRSPGLGVDGEMLIAQASYAISEEGERTVLSLVRPDAFTPEPAAVVRRRGSGWKGGGWQEAEDT